MKNAVNTYLIDSTDNAISIAKLAKQDPKLTVFSSMLCMCAMCMCYLSMSGGALYLTLSKQKNTRRALNELFFLT